MAYLQWKPNRSKGYDYSQYGAYFITVCAKDRCEMSLTNAAIPTFVSTFKRFVNKEIGFSMFQRSYHDHIIRNEAEYQKIWKYIYENILRWREDCFYTE